MREITGIPVIGYCLASMLVTSSICEKFSVVTVLKVVVSAIEEEGAQALILGCTGDDRDG